MQHIFEKLNMKYWQLYKKAQKQNRSKHFNAYVSRFTPILMSKQYTKTRNLYLIYIYRVYYIYLFIYINKFSSFIYLYIYIFFIITVASGKVYYLEVYNLNLL